MKKLLLCTALLALLLITACAQEPAAILPEVNEPVVLDTDEPACFRERLMAQGFSEDELDSLIESDVSLQNMYNQGRFMEYIQKIMDNQSIGPSDTVIAPRYFGGLFFDDQGIPNITVTAGAFDDPDSSTAIAEMWALGMIVRRGDFTQAELQAASETLWEHWDRGREVGLTSSGQGAENALTVWLDPYNDEVKAAFTDFLIEIGIDPAMIIIEPAVTQDMLDWREAAVAAAIYNACDQIVPVGPVTVSRIGIVFTLENRTDFEFFYGSPWDLAYYSNGQWRPVPHRLGVGSIMWTSIGYSLQGGGIKEYRQDFDWFFDELPPGRYMFIRDGSLGQWDDHGWNRHQERVYALVEFHVTADSPVSLPPQAEEEWENFIHLVEYRDTTPRGMTIVISNSSRYDIDHRVQIMTIVEEEVAAGMPNHWDWNHNQLPWLPIEGYWIDYLMQGEGFLPAGGELEFTIDWTTVFGELPPGEYRIVMDVGGRAHPPHPTGWAFGDVLIISFSI
ncbi:MAG: hypothetical protein FWC73_09390 [Defluviitaleaceae bacterium]|nr:hypothetical protein [Defluviitaleaceae bacterium]